MDAKLKRRAELGRRAEALAAEHLEREGFVVLARNARVGRLELDLIAQRGRLLIFCEVRSRSDDRFIAPADTIDWKKQARLRRAARAWMKKTELRGADLRFDAACVVFEGAAARLRYYAGAF